MALQDWVGGRLVMPEGRRFVCPRLGKPVEVTVLRDIRTGQFKRVESCTVFAKPWDVRCDRDCVAAMNLGYALEGVQGRP